MRSLDFDPQLLGANDFAQSGIVQPLTIRHAVRKRQAEFLAGRLCARSALSAIRGPFLAPSIGANRMPIWPQGFCGSITHKRHWAAAVATRCGVWRSIGLDAEILLSDSAAVRLIPHILTNDEQKRFAKELRDFPGWFVTLVFSIKEALFKSIYPLSGKYFYFKDAEVLSWCKEGKVRLRLLADLSSEWQHGRLQEGLFALEDHRLLSLVLSRS